VTKLFDSALTTAPLLLGALLTHRTPAGDISGIIVETEAYTQDDPASHTFRGKTLRNASMFEQGGTIYIYFTYGMHYCMNFVCGPPGRGEGVLIRALQPVSGLELMRLNRHQTDERLLTNGPAKLVEALGVPKSYNGLHLDTSNFSLQLRAVEVPITVTTRVGIKQGAELPWRFYITGNQFVSKR
jgi:DNA-3-methyladenine glycosylase